MDTATRMKENAALSRALAAQSMVLLRNTDNTLPLLGTEENPVSLAVFGVGQIYTVKGGTGSGNVNNPETIPVLTGLIHSPTLQPDELLARKYRSWCLAHENLCVEGFMEPKGYYNPEMPLTDTEIREIAQRNDTAVMVLSRVAGEGADMRAEPGMIYLTDSEKTLMDQITGSFPKSILLINTAGYLELGEYASRFSAVLFMGLPGQDAGAAADVLIGKVMPTGRLTDTWPMRYQQFPTAGDYSEKHFNGNVTDSMGATQEQVNVRYTDDIYVGYRYFNTFHQEVLYPFGYGIGYGKTEITAYSMAVTGDRITVTATVENTGSVYPDRQVVQVYITCPEGKLEQPSEKLCAYAKTRLLQPGESQTLSMDFRLSNMASFDESISAYVLENGYYIIRVGTDSRSTSVAGAVFLPASVTTLELSDRMGHTPEDFHPLSSRGVETQYYPGEEEELAYARTHAVRLSTRDFQRTRQTYSNAPKLFRRGHEVRRLSEALSGACSVREVVAGMDTSDLCALVCGVGMDLSGMPQEALDAPNFSAPFDCMTDPGGMRVPGAAGQTADLWEKYGIPPVSLADGPAGIRITRQVKDENGDVVREQNCTAFPVGSLLACSWDAQVLRQFGEAVAREMLEYGVDIWLAPGMNIHRNPLCGRNFEYFSEDPYVAGCCAAAITKGVQSRRVGVTIKHFAGNNQETLRANSNDIVSQRALREIYLRGFEIAVKQAQPYCVMTSYNDINGMPSANNYDLTTAILRDEWGFKGFVMTDWGGGISKPALSMTAGNDMIQPGGPAVAQELADTLASGEPTRNRGVRDYADTLSLPALQNSAVHILSVILRCERIRQYLKDTEAEEIGTDR